MDEQRTLSAELLHFAPKPVRRVNDAVQGGGDARRDKPNGFWVSVGPAWPEWCIANDFAVGSLKTVTRVTLAAGAKILWLASADALDEFTECYGIDRGFAYGRDAIDWPRVAEQYDGIVIAPYCYERRHSLSWYYSWDVASGCIWNARAIAALDSVTFAVDALAGSVSDV